MRASLVLTLAAALAVAACGPAAPATEGGADSGAGAPPAAEATQSMPTEAAASAPSGAGDAGAAMPAGGTALSGEDFIAQAASLDGQQVTLGRCSLMTQTVSGGQMPCRVVDANDKDLKTPDGLPVDVFISEAGLSEAAKAYLAAECASGFCTVGLAGTLKVSPETFFLEMRDVSFGPAQ